MLRVDAINIEKFSKIRIVIKDTVVIRMRRCTHMFKVEIWMFMKTRQTYKMVEHTQIRRQNITIVSLIRLRYLKNQLRVFLEFFAFFLFFKRLTGSFFSCFSEIFYFLAHSWEKSINGSSKVKRNLYISLKLVKPGHAENLDLL